MNERIAHRLRELPFNVGRLKTGTPPRIDGRSLDYSVLQQCMHCGMCLPTCPTYDATKLERNSPRGRIALMRAIADDAMDIINLKISKVGGLTKARLMRDKG